MAKVIVLTSEPLSAARLRQQLDEDDEVLVVAPALHASGLRFWVSDADEAIARAQSVARETVGSLEGVGIEAQGDTGEGDPLQAIADTLVSFAADRVLIFTRPEEEQRYREQIDSGELRKRFGVEVHQVALHSS
ncbi:MAG: hypothetical protein NVSMB51_03750 [Solirubrobacteraceae bacterium]